MDNSIGFLAAVGDRVMRLLESIPFPSTIKKLLMDLSDRASEYHRYAPLILGLVVGFIAAEMTLWILRLPLLLLWQVFGQLSNNNVSVLFVYNILAHVIAFVVALKLVYEMRPIAENFQEEAEP